MGGQGPETVNVEFRSKKPDSRKERQRVITSDDLQRSPVCFVLRSEFCLCFHSEQIKLMQTEFKNTSKKGDNGCSKV